MPISRCWFVFITDAAAISCVFQRTCETYFCVHSGECMSFDGGSPLVLPLISTADLLYNDIVLQRTIYLTPALGPRWNELRVLILFERCPDNFYHMASLKLYLAILPWRRYLFLRNLGGKKSERIESSRKRLEILIKIYRRVGFGVRKKQCE